MESKEILERLRRKEERRRKRERLIILGVFVLFCFLTYLEIYLTGLSQKLPFINSILFFALINLNLILIGLLIFLVFRNVVKLFWERRVRLLGSKLKTKLVVVFVSFAFIPSLILFTVSALYINNSFGKWFNVQLTHSLQNALDIHANTTQTIRERSFHFGEMMSRKLTQWKLLQPHRKEALIETLQKFQKEYALDAIEIFTNLEGKGIATVHPSLGSKQFPPLDLQFLREGFLGRQASTVQSFQEGELIRCVIPLLEASKNKAMAAMVVSSYVSPHLVEKISKINSAYAEYREVKTLKRSLKTIYFALLTLVTLLIIFTAVWLGFHLARELTIPIQRLVEGTEAVVQKNLDIQIQYEGNDELAMLIRSFNKMIRDLKESSLKLAQAYQELQKSNVELEESGRYMGAILKNIKAGVVSVDSQGMITTINKAAEDLLGIKAYKYMSVSYKKVLTQEYLEFVEGLRKRLPDVSEHTVSQQMKVKIQDQALTLLVSVTMMRDEDGKYLGMVIVFDNLTDLIKAQRVAAWREVARRIAHEIKNPLTPIKLSAQRLRRKYLSSTDQVFDECTKMIITQVDELKDLVNEFSQFAKLPEAYPKPCELGAIVKEVLALYQEAHKHIEFRYQEQGEIPILELDRDQMKRVFINIVDNAISAMGGKGALTVEAHMVSALQLIVVEVSDTGVGIPDELKSRLFEPYFSTKKEGTGLGLTIVRKIISDHRGYIRVVNNKPKGSKFIIELPA